jgi:hypothetical protein
LGSLLSHVFLYAADPLVRKVALAQGLSSALPSFAQFRGIFPAIIDLTLALGILAGSARCI